MPITTTTVAQFQRSKPKALADGYIILGAGKPGLWFPAPADAADLDNGGTFLRDGLGRGIARSYEGLRSAAMFDMRPGKDISERLQRYISDLTPGEYGSMLAWQPVTYEVSGVDLGRTALGFTALEGRATFRGERILRWNDGQGRMVKLNNMAFLGVGKKDWGGLDDNDRRLMDNALLYGNGVAELTGCAVLESPGHGLVLEGWEQKDKPLTNVSGSFISRSLFQRNSGAGLYIVGNNANAVTNFANDFRDNKTGSRDASQVGGTCFANMYHLNREGGNNRMDGSGCIGHSQANYYEEDPGGKGNTYGGECFVREAQRSGAATVGPHVDFQDAYHPFNWRREANGSYSYYPKDDSGTPLMQYGSVNAALAEARSNDVRPAAGPWVNTTFAYVGGKGVGLPVDSLAAALELDYFFQAGDTIQAVQEGRAYVCVRGGNGGRKLTGVTATVTPNSGGQLVVAGDTDQLQPGTVVELAGHAAQIQYLSHDVNNGLLAIGEYQIQAVVASQPLSYPAPQFQPLT